MKKISEERIIEKLKVMTDYTLGRCRVLKLCSSHYRLKKIEESLSNNQIPKCRTVEELQNDLKNDCLGIDYVSRNGWIDRSTVYVPASDNVGYVVIRYVQELMDSIFSKVDDDKPIDMRALDSYYGPRHEDNHSMYTSSFKRMRSEGYTTESIMALLNAFIPLCEKYRVKCNTWGKYAGTDGKVFFKNNTSFSTFPTIMCGDVSKIDIIQVRDGLSHNGYSIEGDDVHFDLTHGSLHYEKDVVYSVEQLIAMHELADMKMEVGTLMLLFIQMSSLCHGNVYG